VPTPEDIEVHVRALTAFGPRHRADTGSVAGTLRYLTDQLAGFGYQVRVERYGSELDEVNLLADLPGTDASAPVLEVGAHWDTVEDSPGADDNASGVAGVLEIARALRGSGQRRRTVRFCLFGGEEGPDPGLHGSRAHVARLDAAQGPRVEGAIVLEMIGYRATEPGTQRFPAGFESFVAPPYRGDFIAVVADESAADYAVALDQAAKAHVPELSVVTIVAPVEHLGAAARSDHVPYWAGGFRGVMVTDTSDYRNPHYHLLSDTLDTLDVAFAARVTVAVTAAVAALAGEGQA
jgi:Zn-dependent M28 family amino/carboxypeptidase